MLACRFGEELGSGGGCSIGALMLRGIQGEIVGVGRFAVGRLIGWGDGSIGSQWRSRLPGLDRGVENALRDVPEDLLRFVRMNVRLVG
jgi:hypothetical protein